MDRTILGYVKKILSAIEKSEHYETLQKFANLQNLLGDLGYRNVLLLATQAKKLGVDLNDVRIVNEWIKDDINPSALATPLVMLAKNNEKDTRGIYIDTVTAFDISQTDAVEKGIAPKSLIIQSLDLNYLLDRFKNHLKSETKIVIKESDTYSYLPFVDTININSNDTIEKQINESFKMIIKDCVYGETIKKETFVDNFNTPFDTAINKIAANSILNRFSIDPNLTDNQLSYDENEALYKDVEKTIQAISLSVKSFNEKIMLNKFIDKNFSKTNEVEELFKEFKEKLQKTTSNIKPVQNNQKPKRKGYVDFKDFQLSKEDAKILKDKVNDELSSSNPENLLSDLNYEITEMKGSTIKFKRRAERTASASFTIKDTGWVWSDLGDSVGGNSITLVKDAFPSFTPVETYEYICNSLNVPNYWKLKLEELEYQELSELRNKNWTEIEIEELYYSRELRNNGTDETQIKKLCEEFKLRCKNKINSASDLPFVKSSSIIANNKPLKSMNEYLNEHEEKTKKMKKANAELEKLHSVNSKVTYVSKTIPQKFITWLKEERGISNTDIKGFYYIKGETWKLDENDNPIDIKQKEGVGVLCADDSIMDLQNVIQEVEEKGSIRFDFPYSSDQYFGADVHFPPYTFKTEKGNEVTMKTQSFGSKKNSTFIDNYSKDKYSTPKSYVDSIDENSNTSYCAIESKMDYAAASQQINFNKFKCDVDIANSTSNADMIAKNISMKNYKTKTFLNQFDIAGIKFLVDVSKMAHDNGHTIKDFFYLHYEDNEYKNDVNDLVKEGVEINKRFKKGTLKDLKPYINVIRKIETEPEKVETLDKLEKYLDDTVKDLKPTSSATLKL